MHESSYKAWLHSVSGSSEGTRKGVWGRVCNERVENRETACAEAKIEILFEINNLPRSTQLAGGTAYIQI